MTFRFRKTYLWLASFVFAVEVFIAVFVKDRVVRPFVGDVLVVVLIYCFLRVFLNASRRRTAAAVLVFAFTIEILQFFDFVKLVGLENNPVLSVALGRTFDWLDLAAYLTGFILIVTIEKFYERRPTD